MICKFWLWFDVYFIVIWIGFVTPSRLQIAYLKSESFDTK